MRVFPRGFLFALCLAVGLRGAATGTARATEPLVPADRLATHLGNQHDDGSMAEWTAAPSRQVAR